MRSPETIIFYGEVLADGRKRVTVVHPDCTWSKPSTYTTVRNIDGSNRLMRDGAYWSFLPHDLEHGAYAALPLAEGKRYQWAHCVPSHFVI